MQRLSVYHVTTYHYAQPVTFGEHRMMLRPRDSHDLRLLSAELRINPQAHLRWIHDVFGNSVAVAMFAVAADTLTIESTILIERFAPVSWGFPMEPFASTLPFSYPASEVPDLGRTIERHYRDPNRKVTEWTRRFLNDGIGATNTEDFLLKATGAICEEFQYAERYDPGVQTPLETLEKKSGTCRDYALFMMEAVRSVGLAARFVSGYLYDPAIDGGPSDITGAGSTRAWVEVYLPGAGWVEFDPTNGSYGTYNLVRIAVARDPSQAIPISGTFTGGSNDFVDLTIDVTVKAVSDFSNAGAA